MTVFSTEGVALSKTQQRDLDFKSAVNMCVMLNKARHEVMKPALNEYSCPIMAAQNIHSWVSKEYCDSFARGQGCSKKPTCPAYNHPEDFTEEALLKIV